MDEVVTDCPIPFPRSYWAKPGRLLAGCYPGDQNSEVAQQKLLALLDRGIRAIVNLMTPDEVGHGGEPFAPYEEQFERLAAERGIEVHCVRMPVRDMTAPTRGCMRQILDAVDLMIERGFPVYVHCWGGRGRTGTVAGCWLARHGMAAGDSILDQLQYLRRNDETSHMSSPQTKDQCDMVRSWRDGE